MESAPNGVAGGAPSLMDLPSTCLTRICRWLWSSSSSSSSTTASAASELMTPEARISFSAEEGKALFGLIISCRTLHAALTPLASWAALFQALLEETRGPDHRPLPPHLELGFHINLAAQPEGRELVEDKETKRKLDEKHRQRVYVRTWFATLAYERWAAELARTPQLWRVPSRMRQLLRGELAHRCLNFDVEVYAACLPPFPRLVFRQPLVMVTSVLCMAMRLASVPVESLKMELPAAVKKRSHAFGGTAEKRTGFKGTRASRLQADLDGEHILAHFWTFTLQKIIHGLALEDSSDEEEEDDKENDEDGANEDDEDDDEDQMEIDFEDEKAVKRNLRAPGVRSLDADTITQLASMLALPETEEPAVKFRLIFDYNWGPYGHPSEFEMSPEAIRMKRMRLLPYQLPERIGLPFHTCHLTPLHDFDPEALEHTHDDFLYETTILAMSSTGSAVLGWRVREKIDVTAHSESDSSVASSDEGDDYEEVFYSSNSDSEVINPTD